MAPGENDFDTPGIKNGRSGADSEIETITLSVDESSYFS